MLESFCGCDPRFRLKNEHFGYEVFCWFGEGFELGKVVVKFTLFDEVCDFGIPWGVEGWYPGEQEIEDDARGSYVAFLVIIPLQYLSCDVVYCSIPLLPG
jgi:hypothetical protein